MPTTKQSRILAFLAPPPKKTTISTIFDHLKAKISQLKSVWNNFRSTVTPFQLINGNPVDWNLITWYTLIRNKTNSWQILPRCWHGTCHENIKFCTSLQDICMYTKKQDLGKITKKKFLEGKFMVSDQTVTPFQFLNKKLSCNTLSCYWRS